MVQSLTGITELATTTAANHRKPTYRVKFDWARTGFDGTGVGSVGDWTDESAHVQDISGSMQAIGTQRSIAAIGHSVSNVCYVTMNNDKDAVTGRRFSSTNTSGPLYSYIGDGKINMVRCVVEMGFYSGATAQRTRQITGYVVNVTESASRGTITFEIRDRAALFYLTETATMLYTSQSARGYIETILALQDLDGLDIDTELVTAGPGLAHIEYCWMDDEKLWAEISEIAQSQLGRAWFDKNGDLHFEDGSYLVHSLPDWPDDSLTSQYTFTSNDYGSVEPFYDHKTIFNDVVVEYTPRYETVLQTIYEASEIHVVPPGETLEIRAEFRYPCRGHYRHGERYGLCSQHRRRGGHFRRRTGAADEPR